MKSNKKIAVLTSGGDAPGMNNAIRAVVLSGIKNNFEIYGVKDGYLGLYENKIDILNVDKFDPRIVNTGGTCLGTSRFKKFATNLIVRQKCAENLKDKNIDKLIIIGGNGSYHGAMKLEELGIKCIGIPATIDNDIQGTDFTIGFSTAVNNILNTIGKLRDTSLSHCRCSILEVMGRNKGSLALYSGIAAGVDLIVTQENLIEKKIILDKVKKMKEENKRYVIIVITEHILEVNFLAKEIENYSGFETRGQILGHSQRGGSPTLEDCILATRMGVYAVELLKKDIHNCGVSLQKQEITHLNFENIFNSLFVKDKILDILEKL
ncbi:ATP-dependent 6-phosphofructokinase [Candidatus Phytoplasma pini]|uniref:6-phosphofructokinase n=1 Tax=Candidatus Phytoplasma pini TaxID=267362 RepID=A0A559KJA2_9MOLU|nr:ATP-dependent 6-phosphofructokinase [Candidatus Phytoplasma pini]TVY12187.1 6-phosphofructokinase [Candidatus Phytoplasma pini]